MPIDRLPRWLAALFTAAAAVGTAPAGAQTLIADASPVRGELVVNLRGDLWSLPYRGGVAEPIAETVLPASRVRWSPDGRRLVYQGEAGTDSRLFVHELGTGQGAPIGVEGALDRHPAWHPGGERIVFSSARAGSFDLWETDLDSGLEWRLTTHPADDVEPAWSPDGRHLAWVRRAADGFSLMLRRFGRPARVLVHSDERIAAPSFRPDGTLLTYFQAGAEDQLRMVILSEPPVDRILASDDDLQPVPVAWLDRSRFVYSVGDSLRLRNFDDRVGRRLAVRAAPRPRAAAPEFQVARRTLPARSDSPDTALVIRPGRVFDGNSSRYRSGIDIVIRNGEIAEISESRPRDLPLIELSSTTLLPGLIDARSRLPQGTHPGAELLAWGITTVVAEAASGAESRAGGLRGARLLPAWPSLGTLPEPVVVHELPYLIVANGADTAAAGTVAAWQALGVPVLADSWTQATRLPTRLVPAAAAAGPTAKPAAGGRVASTRTIVDLHNRQLLSGLADRSTEGLARLYALRQAAGLEPETGRANSRSLLGDLRRARLPVVLGSAANGFPAGLATHAELLALTQQGLPPEQALRSAGRHAATALGLTGLIGEINVGARADLLLVNGDPLANIADLQRIVAVVIDGHFVSIATLLDAMGESVE